MSIALGVAQQVPDSRSVLDVRFPVSMVGKCVLSLQREKLYLFCTAMFKVQGVQALAQTS